MPTDTQVNDLKINVLSEAQYEQIQSPSDTELYLVPETVDTTPSSGSTNPITSGGVYDALQNIPEQEQSDWNETDATDPAYIKNKPTIPDSTSDLTNDSGFITLNDVPTEVVYFTWTLSGGLYKSSMTPANILAALKTETRCVIGINPIVQSSKNECLLYHCMGYVEDSKAETFELFFTHIDGSDVYSLYYDSSLSKWNYFTFRAQELLIGNGTGQNIKTINNTSLLGSGNITIHEGDDNVQSDWNQTNSTADDYIKNKPEIPVIPTNISSFANDAGYITDSDLPTIDSEISETSTNPVQNKAIGIELRKLWNKKDIVSRLDNEYTSHKNYISSASGKWGSSSTYKHWIVPVADIREVTVESNSSTEAYIAFLDSYESTTDGTTPDYSDGWETAVSVAVGGKRTFKVPEGAMFMYLNTGNDGSAKAAHIYMTGIGITDEFELPSLDNNAGKVLAVNSTETDVEWIKPVTIYSGTSAPSSSLGADGDIYIQTT